jgi:hypothetical protein
VENVPADRDHYSGHRDRPSGVTDQLIAIIPESVIGIILER